MNAARRLHDSAEALLQARRALARPGTPFRALPERLVVVDADRQRLALVEQDRVVAEYPISTGAAGVGAESDSGRTPPGWHRVHEKIGLDAPLGTVFRDRLPTGEVWRGERTADDLILSRILRLEGLEDGVNRGPGVDSLERYIYIHGTNDEDHLGRPASHGCVRMGNADVADLFRRVAVGDPVVIVANEPDA